MSAQNSIHVSDELLAELQAKAWRDLLAYGLERGQASGFTEEDVPNVVRENRRRHHE